MRVFIPDGRLERQYNPISLSLTLSFFLCDFNGLHSVQFDLNVERVERIPINFERICSTFALVRSGFLFDAKSIWKNKARADNYMHTRPYAFAPSKDDRRVLDFGWCRTENKVCEKNMANRIC